MEDRSIDDNNDDKLETVPNCCNRLFRFAAAVAISLPLLLLPMGSIADANALVLAIVKLVGLAIVSSLLLWDRSICFLF